MTSDRPLAVRPPRRGFFFRVIRGIGASRLGIWLLSPTLHLLDRLALRLSGGKATLAEIVGGASVVMIRTAGSSHPQSHEVPVLAIPAGEAMLVIASNWGRARHPVWYKRLRANPKVAIRYRNRTGTYVARELDGAEREMHWQIANQIYPGYGVYQRRCPQRRIPVIMLHPSP
ncbi:MAG TPA: nitroreductase/quinone reductase family protein [Anaerolineales bacterium]|nr:nitroreductase/quinone reductase family protein [Anaerolineales bacterium]